MGNVISIIVFVLIMSAIIIVHELGHLIAAKRFGVYCKEFSIGMGPVLWQRQIGETAWSLRALPIGGFVAMA
ncbi:MAG: site-2 protease family protein, partial [Longicatena sp.]